MDDALLSKRLDTFLAARGTTCEKLLAAIGEPFGSPLLVVATGSILHGVGNERSDIDIQIVVERQVSSLPLPSYTENLLVDTVYFDNAKVKNWAGKIRDHPWPLPGPVSYKRWERYYFDLFDCTRFGYGLMLSARDGWDEWLAEFREPWLLEQIVEWWRTEAIRAWIGARWLAAAKPLLAAYCLSKAVRAALEGWVATAGQPYFRTKWLSEKLRILGDDRRLAILRQAMRLPKTEQEARSFLPRDEALLAELGCRFDDKLAAQLWYVPGVKLRSIDGRTLVSRWNLNGLEVRGGLPALSEPPAPLWEGNLDTLPPADLLTLFVEDMTWLSIIAKNN